MGALTIIVLFLIAEVVGIAAIVAAMFLSVAFNDEVEGVTEAQMPVRGCSPHHSAVASSEVGDRQTPAC